MDASSGADSPCGALQDPLAFVEPIIMMYIKMYITKANGAERNGRESMATKAAIRPRRPRTRQRMVRKQVYILPKQDAQLKRLAQEQETTEAELIRAAIDGLLNQKATIRTEQALPPDEAAWQAILAFVDQRRAEGVPGEPYQWKREDGYDDERYRRPWAQPVTAV